MARIYILDIKRVMEKRNVNDTDASQLHPSYQNGQSEAEKLMRRHLQEPGHVLTDEELQSIKVKNDDTIPAVNQTNTTETVEDSDDNTIPARPDVIITPLDVLGS